MEIQRADPKLRRIAVLLLVALVVVGVVALLALQNWLSAVSRAATASAQTQLLAAAFGWLVGATCFALLVLGIYLWQTAAQVLAAAQFPPPGVSVVRDTVVLRGAVAMRRGRIIRGIGVALVLCCLALAVAAWRLHSEFSGRAALPAQDQLGRPQTIPIIAMMSAAKDTGRRRTAGSETGAAAQTR